MIAVVLIPVLTFHSSQHLLLWHFGKRMHWNCWPELSHPLIRLLMLECCFLFLFFLLVFFPGWQLNPFTELPDGTKWIKKRWKCASIELKIIDLSHEKCSSLLPGSFVTWYYKESACVLHFSHKSCSTVQSYFQTCLCTAVLEILQIFCVVLTLMSAASFISPRRSPSLSQSVLKCSDKMA